MTTGNFDDYSRAEDRTLVAAALLEKERTNPDDTYRELFPRLLLTESQETEGAELDVHDSAVGNEGGRDIKEVLGGVLVPLEQQDTSKELATVDENWEREHSRSLVVKPATSGAEDGIVDVASATPLKEQWRTFHSEGKLLHWKKKCSKDVMGLAFRTWLVQTPLVSEMADKLEASTYYELVYHVKRRKYESFKTWSIVVAGVKAMNRLGLMRWRLGLQKKAFLAWLDYLAYAKSKSRNARRSVVHRVRLKLRIKHHFFEFWRQQSFKAYKLNVLGKRLTRMKDFSTRNTLFRKWRILTLILIYERKKKSLQTVVTWQWLTRYTALHTESENKIEQLEKECQRLYDWEKTTCKELKDAAQELEMMYANKSKLEKELTEAKDLAMKSREAGFLQAMEASRNLLPNVSRNISMLSLAHMNLKSSLQNELEVSQEQMKYYFKAIANRLFAEQQKTDEKVKAMKNYYEKNIVMILSGLRDKETEDKIQNGEDWNLEEILPSVLEKISKLQEVKDDADAAMNAKQIQLDIVTKNADETIQTLKESSSQAQEALASTIKEVETLKSVKYAHEKQVEQLLSERENQKKVYDMLFAKHENLSEEFVKTSEKSNAELKEMLKVKDEEIKALHESTEGIRKRMEEQQTGHNSEISILKEMSDDLQENLEAALNDLAKSKRHAEELNVKHMSYNFDIEKEQIKVQDLDERYKKVYEELQSLKAERIDLKSNVDKFTEDNLELSKAKSSLEESLADKESKLDASRQQNTELEANKENYVIEIKELKAEIEALQESVNVRSSKLQDIEQAKLELITNAMMYEEEIAGLKADKDVLQDNVNKKNAKLQDVEQQKAELESLVDGYLENNVDLNNEKEGLQQTVAKKTSKIEEMESLRSTLESKIEAQNEDLKALSDKNRKLTQSLEKKTKILEDKDSGMSLKTSQLDDLTRQHAEFEGTIESQKDEIKHLENDKEKLKQTIERKNQQLQDKENKLSDKALHLSKLEGKFESQTDELQNIKVDKEKLQQNIEKKSIQLKEFADLQDTHAKLESTIENQSDEIKRLKSEKDRLAMMNDKRTIQLQAKDSDISHRLSQMDDMERKIHKLESLVDSQKSEARHLKSENDRLQKRAEQLSEFQEKYEEQELSLKDLKAESRDLQKVKDSFVKYKGLLSVITDKIVNKQLQKLDSIESDVKEFSYVSDKLYSLFKENEDLVKELAEVKMLSDRLMKQRRQKGRKPEPSSFQQFKKISRRASFMPTQLPTQVWADETNRPRVADLVNANESLLSKIEKKANKGGGIKDMMDLYIMRKAFAVWLQAVGSEKALERLQKATESIPT